MIRRFLRWLRDQIVHNVPDDETLEAQHNDLAGVRDRLRKSREALLEKREHEFDRHAFNRAEVARGKQRS